MTWGEMSRKPIKPKNKVVKKTASPASPIRSASSFILPRGSFHSAIAESIGTRIVRGEYPPGSILPNEAQWSADFRVSRSAVREAIKMLMAKNLLVSHTKIGSRVEPKDRWNLLDRDVLSWYSNSPDRGKFLHSLQQFRYIFEPEAAALAAEFRTPGQMEEISAACHEMAVAPTLAERAEADVRFHVGILRGSNNELLMPLGALIDSALNNLFVLITRQARDLHYAQDLHTNIERAIGARKPNAARVAVQKLLKNSDAMIRKWEKNSFD